MPRYTLTRYACSGHLTRGYAVPHLTGAPTQMPPLDLYDDKMIHFEGGDGTSHTREPLNEIVHILIGKIEVFLGLLRI